MIAATVLADFETGDYMRWGSEAGSKFLFWSDETTEITAAEDINNRDDVVASQGKDGLWEVRKVAANDNGFVNMHGGGNTNSTLAALERMHAEISYVDPDRIRQPSSKPTGATRVYVIGGVDPDFIKIGKASSTLDRLRSLQTGNPLKLYIHRIFWLEKPSDATKVEVWAHQDASRLYGRGIGEWFKCGPVEAHNIIADICEKERIKCGVTTPKIDSQWKLDQPTGAQHLAREAESRRLYWEERERKDNLKYGTAS